MATDWVSITAALQMPRVKLIGKFTWYQIQATLVPNPEVVEVEMTRADRFILATNVLDTTELSADDALREYKDQQSNERGFCFLWRPLFFTSSVFVKSPKRVEALAMVMGLCLLVYYAGSTSVASGATALLVKVSKIKLAS